MLGAGGRHCRHRAKLGLRLGSSRSCRAKAGVGTSAIFSMFLTDLSRSSISRRVAMSTSRGAYLLLVDGDGNAGGVVRQCRSVRRCVGTYLHVRWDFEKFWSVVICHHNTGIFLGSLSSQPTLTTTLPVTTAPGRGHQCNRR